ncbi:MAG TPA: hypothetical protein VGO47_01660 [Chlamydiales bacterium]|nr:hypothetical protein [Chlamydiales bacterium]
MMDTSSLIPGGFHFSDSWSHDGTTCGFKYHDRRDVGHIPYYFIDFGLSGQYPSFEERGLIGGRVGQDRTVPEFSDTEFFDPFKVDIYQLGGVFKEMEDVSTLFPLFIFVSNFTCRHTLVLIASTLSLKPCKRRILIRALTLQRHWNILKE